jgi:hypothetical protein
MGSDRALRKKRTNVTVLGMGWEDDVRARIQSSKVANRLISFVLGEVQLEPAQVTAALGLLKKVLPDLSSSENKTEVLHRFVARVPNKTETSDQWQQQNAPKQIPTIQ